MNYCPLSSDALPVLISAVPLLASVSQDSAVNLRDPGTAIPNADDSWADLADFAVCMPHQKVLPFLKYLYTQSGASDETAIVLVFYTIK